MEDAVIYPGRGRWGVGAPAAGAGARAGKGLFASDESDGLMYNLKSQTSALLMRAINEESARSEILPSLVSAYQEHGFEAGYSRGVNDALAAVLEVAEEFARLRPESAAETRRVLYAFSEFLESRVRQTPPDEDFGFVDGLGIWSIGE